MRSEFKFLSKAAPILVTDVIYPATISLRITAGKVALKAKTGDLLLR